jgi:2-polyprenyl-3-methyl-5-hydroxy-6-metoxy-1,4-benzoquinol methylase
MAIQKIKSVLFKKKKSENEHFDIESYENIDRLKLEVNLALESYPASSDISSDLMKLARDLQFKKTGKIKNFSKTMVRVIADRPIAFDSLDHTHPWGTAHDNSQNIKFNLALLYFFDFKEFQVLDIGCSGGGLVKTLLDVGVFAVGIEGSDYSRNRLRAEWATIPNFLFTADATFPYHVLKNGKKTFFEVITAWEVLEHIESSKLAAFFENVSRNLARGGYFICSVSPNDDFVNGVNLHRTVHQRAWWLNEVEKYGFTNVEELCSLFSPDKWVRSEENSRDCFHLVLKKVTV